jgi:hypothetical protein
MLRESKTSGWASSCGEALLWLLPAGLALLGHVAALPKALLSDRGPGVHIVMNERTELAQAAWRMLSSCWWLFAMYALLLLNVYALLKVKRIRLCLRVAILAILASPGLYYFWLSSYLAGKVLRLD